jgi:hypothetical protein
MSTPPIRLAALQQELARCVVQVQDQMDVVDRVAQEMNIKPAELRDANGGFIMAPLLSSKALLLYSLVHLTEVRKK